MLGDRVGRVAHDNANIELLLATTALGVVRHNKRQLIRAFAHSEGVSQQDAIKGRVGPALKAAVNALNVDGGDIVGQQHDLVGVQLVAELVLQLGWRDQA